MEILYYGRLKAEEEDTENPYFSRFLKFGGEGKLFTLEKHSSKKVTKLVDRIVAEYFDVESGGENEADNN